MDEEERKARKRERDRRYRDEHREKIAEYHRKRRAEHREKIAERRRDYYEKNREEILGQKREYYADHAEEKRTYDRERQRRYAEWLDDLRTTRGCAVCGTRDGQLHFHHIDPSAKRRSVSEMANCSLDAIEAELEKCVILCPRCHAQAHKNLREARP